MKKKLVIIIFLIVLVSVVWFVRRGDQTMDQQVQPETLYRVSRGDLEATISAGGSLETVRNKDFFFPGAGEVKKVHVQEGEEVNRGDILLELYSHQQRLALLQAERALEQARIDGSSKEVVERELELEMAEIDLANRSVKSGLSGVITRLQIEEGDRIAASEPAVTVMDFRNFLVDIEIDESDSRLVSEGQEVVVEMNAFPGEFYQGKVTDIKKWAVYESGGSVVPGTVTLEESRSKFRPGYSADLEIIVDRKIDQILVPVTAIAEMQAQEFVFIIEDGQPIRRQVETSLSDGLQTVITKGLTEGDEILINVYSQLDIRNVSESFMRPRNSGFSPPGGGF